MAVDLELAPKKKSPNGEPCCEPVVYPDIEREHAERMAAVAKALGDPVRMQLVDVLRKHAGKVCVCELVPLFDLSPADRLTSPEEAARRRDRRFRAPGPVGLLLRQARGAGGTEHMAELETVGNHAPVGSSCCSASLQETCCEPEAKGECCGPEHEAGTCGCSSGTAAVPDDAGELRETVRDRYAKAAEAVSIGETACCGDAAVIADEQRELFGSGLYGRDDRDALPEAAQLASLGCGNPTAVAELHEGEIVLDLGSGRRHRRPALRPARRSDRKGVRPGHDRRDARAGALEPAPGRCRERRVRQGHDRGHPSPRELGRRDHLATA